MQLLEAQNVCAARSRRLLGLRDELFVGIRAEHILLQKNIHEEIVNNSWKLDVHLLEFLVQLRDCYVTLVVNIAINECFLYLLDVYVVDFECPNALH